MSPSKILDACANAGGETVVTHSENVRQLIRNGLLELVADGGDICRVRLTEKAPRFVRVAK